MLRGCLVALAAAPVLVSPALAGSADGHFNVTVRLRSAGQAKVGSAPVAVMSSSRAGDALGARGALTFHLAGTERYRLRLELAERGVESVDVAGLGRPISISGEPVEVSLPAEPDDADHELRISYRVHYRPGAATQGTHAPLRITFLP